MSRHAYSNIASPEEQNCECPVYCNRSKFANKQKQWYQYTSWYVIRSTWYTHIRLAMCTYTSEKHNAISGLQRYRVILIPEKAASNHPNTPGFNARIPRRHAPTPRPDLSPRNRPWIQYTNSRQWEPHHKKGTLMLQNSKTWDCQQLYA